MRGCAIRQAFRRAGVDVRREAMHKLPAGSAQWAAGTGAGRELFSVRAVDVLRPMSDAVFRCDEADICCPMLAWLEGKQYNNVQTMHALNGLGQVKGDMGRYGGDMGEIRLTSGR